MLASRIVRSGDLGRPYIFIFPNIIGISAWTRFSVEKAIHYKIELLPPSG